MNTIAISESDFLQLRTEVSELKTRLFALEAAAAAKPAKKNTHRRQAKRNGGHPQNRPCARAGKAYTSGFRSPHRTHPA